MKLPTSKLIKFTFELREAFKVNPKCEAISIKELFMRVIPGCYPKWSMSYVSQCWVDYSVQLNNIYKDSKYRIYKPTEYLDSSDCFFPRSNISIKLDFLTYCLHQFLDLRTSSLSQNVSDYLEELTNNISELNERISRMEEITINNIK